MGDEMSTRVRFSGGFSDGVFFSVLVFGVEAAKMPVIFRLSAHNRATVDRIEK